MEINRILIKNYRNIENYQADLKKSVNIFVAKNATGKTNLLEAISLFSYGRSILAKKQSQLFPRDSNNQTYYLETEIEREDGEKNKYSLAATRENGSIRKVFKVDDDQIPYSQFVGRVITLLFTTSTIDLLSRSPSSRRRFADRIIWLYSPEYRKVLNRYKKAVRQRNAALETRQPNQIKPWTKAVVENGSIIIRERDEFFKAINHQLTKINKHAKIKFKPSIKLSKVFDESPKELFSAKLNQKLQHDISRCTTSAGPHHDDWTIVETKNGANRDLSAYGSRGEQRMTVIHMLLAIMKAINKILGCKPILLLDDLFSELDSTNQKLLVEKVIQSNFQTIATTTPNIDPNITSRKQINLIKLNI